MNSFKIFYIDSSSTQILPDGNGSPTTLLNKLAYNTEYRADGIHSYYHGSNHNYYLTGTIIGFIKANREIEYSGGSVSANHYAILYNDSDDLQVLEYPISNIDSNCWIYG